MADANGMSIINSHIESGEYARIYLLGGTEGYLVNQYRDKLVSALVSGDDTMNYSVFKGDNANADTIIEMASTMPFFAERRVILVEDSDFFKKGCAELEEFIPQLPESTVLIFSEKNIDKRCKLYKDVAKNGAVAIFDTPDEKTLLIWLKRLLSEDGYSVDDAAVFKLLEYVGADMNNLCNEAEKLKCYTMEDKHITVDTVEALSINQIEGKIFDMMEALSKRDKKKTIDLYSDLLELREPAMRILYLITRQFNLLLKTKLAVENNANNSSIASLLKLQPFVVKKYVSQCAGYTYEELIERVNLCQEADSDIKTGRMRDTLAVEMLIMKLLV